MERPPILLLHGALGTSKQFDSFAGDLDSEFVVFRFDFECHGTYAVSEYEFSMESLAEQTGNFIRRNRIEGVNIFGYSMGGYVALRMVLEEPELGGKVVTLGTKFNWNPESAKREQSMLIPEVVVEKVPAFASILAARHGPDWKMLMRKTSRMMGELGAGKALNAEDLKSISNKVTIGVGSDDKMVTDEESVWAANSLPNGQLVRLPGIKHPIEQVPPDTLLNYLRSSLMVAK